MVESLIRAEIVTVIAMVNEAMTEMTATEVLTAIAIGGTATTAEKTGMIIASTSAETTTAIVGNQKLAARGAEHASHVPPFIFG
jgi:hypothetical protein